MHADDRESSPDYASRPSEEHPTEREKVRGGTRKVVGDPDVARSSNADSLHIDFGQTLRLTPESSQTHTSRPSTAGGGRSPLDPLGTPGSAGGRRSPFDSLGASGRKSPLNPFDSSSPARNSDRQNSRDRPAHSRSHSYAWQPGTSVNDTRDGLTPEEFVQQRAALAKRPQGYTPHRTHSFGRIEQLKGDDGSRPSSPNSPRRLQKRNPSSRNSVASSVDLTAHLSAREQEHVARVTGGPLISNISQSAKTPDPNVGLIGAIEAREQERRDIKEGLQGRMVQAAIDQRTREARYQQQQEAAVQRTQSQYITPQQQQEMLAQGYPPYHFASDYNAQPVPGVNPSYWGALQQQGVMQQSRPAQVQGPGAGAYQQSMYGVQSAQGQPVAGVGMPMGYPPQQVPVPSQGQQRWSSYNQSLYGGFYAPPGTGQGR